jgi:hypothetical protein
MRLRFSSFPLSHIAQAIGSGRCPFYLGIVPLCFLAGFVVATSRSIAKRILWTPVVSVAVWIVFNCSDHPFFNKTPKNMPVMEKTIKQFITRPPHCQNNPDF